MVITEVLRVALEDRMASRDFRGSRRILGAVGEMRGASASQKCLAAYGQGEILLAEGRMEEAQAAFRPAADFPGIPASLELLCRLRMANAPLRQHRPLEALEAIDAALAIRGADPKLPAWARWDRALVLASMNRAEETLKELDRVVDMPGADLETCMNAQEQRTNLRRRLGLLDEELDAETRSLAAPFLTDFGRGYLLLQRSALWLEMGRPLEAAKDASTVAGSTWVISTSTRSRALTALGRARLECGDPDAALELGARAAALPQVPATEIGDALILRATALHDQQREDAAIEELGKAVDYPGASPEIVGRALVVRAGCLSGSGLISDALRDLSRAVDLPGLPGDSLGTILGLRALAYREQGKLDLMRQDVLRVLAMPEADMAQKIAAAGTWALQETDAGNNMAAREVWGRLLETTILPDDRQELFMLQKVFLSLRSGELEVALEDVTRVLEKPNLSLERKVTALMLRAEIHRQAKRDGEQLRSLTEVIELPGISSGNLINALKIRAQHYEDHQQPDKAAADRAKAETLPKDGK